MGKLFVKSAAELGNSEAVAIVVELVGHNQGKDPTVRESSNPIFRGLNKENRQAVGAPQGYPQQQGYPQGFNQASNFGMGAAGAAQGMQYGQPQAPYQPQTGSRAITVDDVVTKTAITLGVLIAFALGAYAMVAMNAGLATPLTIVGAIGGLVLVLIGTFGRKMDNPAIVLAYAAFEGLFVGSISFVFANWVITDDISAGAFISQAILGTFGVFIGMLVVYKTGAIRVTPRFTRMMFAALIGAVVLALGNLVMGMFTGSAGPLRDGGTLAIIFSLVMIGIAAFSFLLDFDQADQLIRAGAPSKAAWGVAFGLTITLVWLYVEILRLLSYFYSND